MHPHSFRSSSPRCLLPVWREYFVQVHRERAREVRPLLALWHWACLLWRHSGCNIVQIAIIILTIIIFVIFLIFLIQQVTILNESHFPDWNINEFRMMRGDTVSFILSYQCDLDDDNRDKLWKLGLKLCEGGDERIICRFGRSGTSTSQLGQILEFQSLHRPLSGEHLYN